MRWRVHHWVATPEVLQLFPQMCQQLQEISDRSHLGDGDGTVPQVSATPAQMKDIEALSIVDYIAESHGGLQNQPDILLNLLKGIQSAQSISLEDVRVSLEIVTRGKRSGLKGIGLSLDDL